MAINIEELRLSIGRAVVAHTDAHGSSDHGDGGEFLRHPLPHPLPIMPIDDTPAHFLSDHDIPTVDLLAKFDQTVALLARAYDKHSRPYVPRTSIDDYAFGTCFHLYSQYHKCSINHFPYLEAHVYSSAPYERICLACARQRKRLERNQCTICAGRNSLEGRKLKRHELVEVTKYYEPPMYFHIPMCDECRRMLAQNGYATSQFHGPPNSDERLTT